MTPDLPMTAFLLPILAGICFAVIGLGYRLGQARGVSTPIVVWHMGTAGLLWYGFRALDAGIAGAPARIWTLGIAGGLTQTLCIVLIALALARGPLSPIWCATNLIFIPITGYAAFVLGEHVSLPKGLGVTTAVASVLVGAVALGGGNKSSEELSAPPLSQRIVYGAILVGALLTNSVAQLAISDLSRRALPDGEMMMDRYGALYYALLYGTMILPFGVVFLSKGTRGVYTGKSLASGALAAFGSVVGLGLLALSAKYPAAIVFTLSAILSLVGGGLVSVLLFKEQMSRWWFAMMGLACGAVLLVSVG